MPDYPEGYYWVKLHDGEAMPAEISDNGDVLLLGDEMPWTLEQVEVIARMEPPSRP